MTAKQDTLYWREWGAVSRRCKADGLDVPDRHALHAKALGADKSHKTFTNADFDKVLAEFRAWSEPGDLRGQMQQDAMPETRMLWVLDHELVPKLLVVLDGLPTCRPKALGVAHNYVGAISAKKYGEQDFRRLAATDLQNLLRDVTRAVARMAEKKGLTAAELGERAGLNAAEAAADCQPEGEPF